MKKTALMLLSMMFLLAPRLGAVSYPPPPPEYFEDEDVMGAGTLVHLFHSGTRDVSAAIHVNDVLVVYREYPPDISRASRQTGKVRVVAPMGPFYFRGEVVEGYVQPGSLAVKGDAACLVTTRMRHQK